MIVLVPYSGILFIGVSEQGCLVSFLFVQDLFKQTAKCLSHKIVEKTEGLAPDKGNIVEQ